MHLRAIRLAVCLLSTCTSVVSAWISAEATVKQIPWIFHKQSLSLRTCQQLAAAVPLTVSFPGDNAYDHGQASYWSRTQADMKPTCRVAPYNSSELAQLMGILYEHDVKFAIVSGGHSVLVGASNIQSGVTLDLSRLSRIVVSHDLVSTELGAGARWYDVYKTLELKNMTVAGARIGSVGAGGFLLGGGISAVAARYGWSCDSVIGIEAVLANGTLIQTNATHHSDLLRAMKGTGSNFAVATSFTLRNLPHDELDLGFIRFEHQNMQQMMHAISFVTQQSHRDPDLSMEVSITLDPDSHRLFAIVVCTHLGNLTDSPNLKPILAAPYQSRASWRLRPSDLALYLKENNPKGYREQRATLTIRNDVLTMVEIAAFFETATSPQELYRDYFYQPGMIMQPISQAQLGKDSVATTNALGLDDETDSLLLVSFEVRWSEPRYDSVFSDLVATLLSSSQAIARRHGSSHEFVYANYAARGQSVHRILDSKRLLEPLKTVLHDYDPASVFQNRLQQPFPLEALSTTITPKI